MFVSVIVTLYKDLEAIKIVLKALERQTYKNFEVVIAEDAEDEESAKYFRNYSSFFELQHISHPDVGRTKTLIQNKAVKAARGEYLIFIDGDVIPYTTFIESQVKIAKPKQILAGRRVNLNEYVSHLIRKERLDPVWIERFYPLFALFFLFDKETRVEQGFFFSVDSFFYRKILAKRERNVSILGCNWSCFKEDFVAINGFDLEYENSSIGEDTDLDWRFRLAGYKIVSSKNIANVLHLYHPKSDTLGGESGRELMLEKQKKREYICKKGLDVA